MWMSVSVQNSGQPSVKEKLERCGRTDDDDDADGSTVDGLKSESHQAAAWMEYRGGCYLAAGRRCHAIA